MDASNSELNEMENQVTKGAKPAEAMPTTPNYVPDAGGTGVEDLGGPTPQNSKPTDNSNKLKTPSAKLAQTGDAHFKGTAGVVHQDGPLGNQKNGMKSSGYGRGANEEVENDESVVESEVQEIDIDLSSDVQALFEGEKLSESFKQKATAIFEATIKSKIVSLQNSLEESYQAQIEEELTKYKAELQERVDSYLHYVAEEWITENALQVESGVRGELSESFMTGLKGLFEEHYVEIPEDKYDVLEAMVTKLDEMETKLNEQIDSNVALTKRLSVSVSDNILDEVSEGLALSQKEKLAELAQGVEFESEEQYKGQLDILKESYFSKKPVVESQEVISEDAPVVENTAAMDAYLQALTKFQ
tara:strand:+ start:697 stop:1773 length:1077 start_codon:yes stop_codon:yes gene_type:complete